MKNKQTPEKYCMPSMQGNTVVPLAIKPSGAKLKEGLEHIRSMFRKSANQSDPFAQARAECHFKEGLYDPYYTRNGKG